MFPALLSAKQLMDYTGLDRHKAYDLLSREDAPVVIIGRRKFMVRDKVLDWLESAFGPNADVKEVV